MLVSNFVSHHSWMIAGLDSSYLSAAAVSDHNQQILFTHACVHWRLCSPVRISASDTSEQLCVVVYRSHLGRIQVLDAYSYRVKSQAAPNNTICNLQSIIIGSVVIRHLALSARVLS